MVSTANPFDLLVDNESDDVIEIVKVTFPPAVAKKGPVTSKGSALPAAAKLPVKPPPPAQAVREARNDTGRGGGRGPGRDQGNRDISYNGYSGGYKPAEDKDSGRTVERHGGYGAPRGAYHGGRGGGFDNFDTAEGKRPPRRAYERRSGTGRGNDFKRDGAGRGNWGTSKDETALENEELQEEKEKNVDEVKQSGEQDAENDTKEKVEDQIAEKEPEEDKEMTLEEYEKVLEEKRKALLLNKPEERKVNVDKELQKMQQLSKKKANDEVFVNLGSDKEKKKESVDKEEKVKKAVSITEFLKPAEGEKPTYRGHGRGRGRGSSSRGGSSGSQYSRQATLANIEDPGHFPALGGK